jgi:hypothetical protein
MLPTTEVGLAGLLLAVIAAWYFAVATHELGHALAGRLVGMRIVACGIGFARPLASVRLFGTSFFVARRQATGGLVLPVRDRFRGSRGAMMAFIAGGPAVNLAEAAASYGLWAAGWGNPFVVVLFYVSVVLLVVTLVPVKVRLKKVGATFRTDGMQLIQFWRRTRWQETRPGEELETLRAITALSRDLGAGAGVVTYRAAEAMSLAGLGDAEAAAGVLDDPAFSDPDRGEAARGYEAFARAIVAQAVDPDAAPSALERAREVCRDDPVALAALALAEAQAALGRGCPAGDLAQAALAATRASGHDDLVTAAEMLALEAEPPEDLAPRAAALLARTGARRASPVAQLRLLAASSRVLAGRGQTGAARPLFARAQRLLTDLASDLGDARLRDRFLAANGGPLRAAVEAQPQGDGPPLFLTVDDPGQARPARADLGSILFALLGFQLLTLILFLGGPGGAPFAIRAVSLVPFVVAFSVMGGLRAALKLRDAPSREAALLGGMLNLLLLLALFAVAVPFPRADTRSALGPAAPGALPAARPAPAPPPAPD